LEKGERANLSFDDSERDLVILEETAKIIEDEKNEKRNVEIIDYSDKAIAVIGETRSIKEQLKSLGGKFNGFLKCGPGWIFPKTKLDLLKTALY
jgi:hypothetical protein